MNAVTAWTSHAEFAVFFPEAKFMANAAWLALAVMAHNLGRAVGRLGGPDLNKATVNTLQARIFTVPGRLVRSGRRRHAITRLLAMSTRFRASPGEHPGDPHALLINSHHPNDQDPGEAG